MTTASSSMTLAQRLQPRQGVLANKMVFDVLLVLGACFFVALLAQIRIPLPFSPVPITGQTLGVLLSGSLLGSRLGATSMLLYVALGAIGLPVFTGGNGGIEYLQGATLGYLAAYPIVGLLTGWLAERGWDREVSTTVVAMVLGSAVIYLLGAGWMAFGLGMGIEQALVLGVIPFLIGDAIKLAIAVAVLPGGWALLGREKTRD